MPSKLKLKKRGKILFFYLFMLDILDERKANQMTKNPILCMAEKFWLCSWF